MQSVREHRVLALAQPGLEHLVQAELTRLGVASRIVSGVGASFRGAAATIYSANLHLRCASRVLVHLGGFRATTFGQLVRGARALGWEEFLAPGEEVRLRVTCRKSRLYHSDAVAERIADAIARRSGATLSQQGALESTQLIVVRLDSDVCSIAVDSSGAHLHRRGYRQAVTQAPLRETLAAAMLLASGWDARSPLVDPFCGSGTIAIEAALLARSMAPGRQRQFRFMRWPSFDASVWENVLEGALARELPRSPAPIYASDRNGWAVRAARENAERACVAGDVVVARLDVADLVPPRERGWLVTNPPYGARLAAGDAEALRDLLRVVLGRFPGWRLAVLAPAALSRILTGRWLRPVLSASNGGIPVRMYTGQVPG